MNLVSLGFLFWWYYRLIDFFPVPSSLDFLKNACFVWRIKWNPGNGICPFSPVGDAASEGAVLPLTWIGLQGIPFALPMQNSPVSCNLITGRGPCPFHVLICGEPWVWHGRSCEEFWMPPQKSWGQKARGSGWWITLHTHIPHTAVRQLRGTDQ